MKWHDLDPKGQRKALILAALVALALLILIWPAGISLRRPPARPQPPQKPTPFDKLGQVVHAAPKVVPPPAPAKDAGLLGRWQSTQSRMPGHGLCTLWLEVTRKADEPDKYTGAVSLSCIPTSSFTAPKSDTPMTMLLDARDPILASMSGGWEKDDAIVFRVDKVINPKQCGFNGLSISKFGSQNIAAEFQDGCGGGSAVLRKAG